MPWFLESEASRSLSRMSTSPYPGASPHKILSDLKETLDKYDGLQTHGGNPGKRVKRIWKKLTWEPKDIRELRDRIISNVILLNTYIGRMSRYLFIFFFN